MSLASAVRRYMEDWQSTLADWPGLAADRPLLLAVSGGPDSLALLHLFAYAELHPRPLLHVAHFDHQLRPTAPDDARFVAEIAASWGVACHLGTGNVAELAATAGLSIEAAARLARYRFLARTAVDSGAQAIAVAHNADDQAETVLLHLLRGSGFVGLRGMRPVTPLADILPGGDSRAPAVIRPLLASAAAEIRAYCTAAGLEPRIDATNADVTMLRNRLRHEILPLLEAINPGFGERLAANAAPIAADVALLQETWAAAWTALLESQGAGWLRLRRAGWRAAPLSVRRAVLRQAVSLLAPGAELTMRPLEQARRVAERGGLSDLPGGIRLAVHGEVLELARLGVEPPGLWPQVPAGGSPLSLPVPGAAQLGNGWQIRAEWVATPREWGTDPNVVYLLLPDSAVLHVRQRRPGERFQPLGLHGHKSLKAYFQDRAIPATARARWPLVTDAAGVLWVAGHGIAERCRVPVGVTSCVRLTCEAVA